MLVCLLLHNDEVRCKLNVCVALRCSCYWVELSWVWVFVYCAELADQSQRRRTMDHGCWKSWVFSRRLKVLSDSSGCVAKEVDCSRLRDRTPQSSAGQWRSALPPSALFDHQLSVRVSATVWTTCSVLCTPEKILATPMYGYQFLA